MEIFEKLMDSVQCKKECKKIVYYDKESVINDIIDDVYIIE